MRARSHHIDRRHHTNGRTVSGWRQYLPVPQRKSGALRNGVPFAELPEGFRRLQGSLLGHPHGDHEVVEILAVVLHHDEQAVLTAVELTLEPGVPTKTHVLNVLHRLLDGKPPAPLPDLYATPTPPVTPNTSPLMKLPSWLASNT